MSAGRFSIQELYCISVGLTHCLRQRSGAVLAGHSTHSISDSFTHFL